MTRPVIGITASIDTMTSGAWTELTAGTPFAYCRAVQRAGGRAVILVPDEADAEQPDPVLESIDGLLLTGAAEDVDPALYGAAPDGSTTPVAPVRDAFELALARGAMDRDMPLLGVCRGMQVLNVACGGALEQHLPDVVGHDDHRGRPGIYADHEVRLEPGSTAARAAGAERMAVKSHHHQGIRDVAPALRAAGWSDIDGIVEAIEADDRRFALGVLWHPEEDERSRIVAALVQAALAH